MKISIITISNNHAKYIEDCINSVLNQKYKNIEHIIIDNKSDDGTLDILKRIKKCIKNNNLYDLNHSSNIEK